MFWRGAGVVDALLSPRFVARSWSVRNGRFRVGVSVYRVGDEVMIGTTVEFAGTVSVVPEEEAPETSRKLPSAFAMKMIFSPVA